MGKPFWRSVEYFFTGNYSADDGNNNIVAIGFGGQIHAYGGDDHVTVGSIGATVYTGSGNDTVVGGSAYLKVEDSTGHLTVKGAAGYADINKSGDGNVSFAGAAGGVSIDHLGNHGDVSYGGAAAYNGITRKGLSGNVTFAGAGGYNVLWHETNQGNLSFTGAGAGNKLDRTWFNRYQGSHGDVTFDGAGAANSISSRVETGNITFRGAGADNHLVRKGKVGDITLQGAGASNRIERTHQAEDVYTQTRGNIRFEGVGGYNSLYSDVAHGDIHFSGGGAYNTIIRKGSGNDFAKEGMTNAKADEIVLTKAVMSGSWIGQDHHVTAVKSASEPNTYLFAFADSTYTKINKVQLRNDPQTGELKYYSTAWYKEGNHLSNLANQDISDNGGFTAVNINGAYTLSDLKVEHQQSVTVHAVEKSLTEYEWVTYANGAVIDAKEVSLSDAKMGGHAIYADGTKVDVKAVKSNRQPNTYIYAKVLGPYTKIVVVELANDPETGALKYQARSWYKEGDHTANIANQDISSATGYNPMGKGGYSLSDLHYSVNAVRSTSETVADIEEYTDQTLFKPANDSGESSGDVRFNGAGGGNVIKSNVTRGNVHFNGGGIANVILHSSQFGNTEFNGGGAANVIVKSGEEGDLTFRGAGLANVLVHQSQQGKMDVYAGGAVNVLVRLGDGQYLTHLLAYGNISVQKGSGDSRVVMLGGYNTHTQIGSGNGLWLAAGGFNVMTQVGQGDVAAVLAGGANVLTKMGEGELTSGMLGGANVITHISNDDQLSNTTAVALGGANILTKKGKGNTLAVMGGGANVLTHVGDGTTTGVMVGGANILTKVGNGDTTGILLGVGNVLTHVGDGQTLGVMGAAGNIFTKVGDGTSIAVMIGAGNIFTHVGEGNAWALMGGLGNVFTKVGNGDALALMVAEANVFTHIGDGMSVALMLAKGNVATKVGNGTTLAAMVGNANIFTHIGHGSTFAAMIGQANIMTKVGNDLTAALMVGKANIMTHVGDGTSLGLFAGEVNVMTKVGNGTTLAAMFGKANIMTHVGDGLTGVLALGEANIVTKVGDDFMGVVAAAKANVVTHVGDATTAAVLAGKGNILTKVGEGTTVGLLISDVGNVMTHVGDGTTIGIAKGKANLITKVGDGLGVNVAWGQANVFTQVGDGDRYNFAKGEANLITKVGDGQEVSVVQGEANIITHVGNGDDYTGAWGKANVITKVGHGQNVVLAKGEANIVTQVGDGDSFNALWSKGNIVTKVGDGMQVTAAKGQANITTTVGNGLNVTAAYGDANINTKVGDGVSVNVAWGKYNINTKVGDGLNVAVMKGKANANIHVGDGLNINASYAQNNVAIKVGNGDFYSLAVASSNTSSNKLSALFDNIKQTVLGVGGSQAINYLVQGDEASSSGTLKGRGAIATPEITKLDGFQMDAIKEVSSDLGDSLTGSVTKVDTPDLNKMQHALNVDDSSVQAPNLIVNGDFEQGEHGWQSTHGVEASYAGSVYGVEGEGHGARVTELDTYTNTSLYQDLANLAQGEVIAVSFDFAKRAGISNNEGIDVLWNGEVVFSSSGDESAWQQKTLKLTAHAGSNRIEFKGTGHDDGLGYILDNVVAKSETPQQTNAVSEHATQNQASQNALSDKDRAEADRQRLEQEKRKQLDAVAGSQSQLESTDQQALENNGQAQRDAVKEESEAVTAELAKLAQGLDVLDGQATHTGESGDQWRNEFASGLLAGVQTQLDDAKQLANDKIAEAKQTHADNQNKVKDAVAKSEAGVAQGEQNRAVAEQDIADAKTDAEKRKADALAKGKDAQQAESDAHHAVNNAQSRGDRDVQLAENKANQAQADAQGAKQNEGDRPDRPDRQGVTGSGLSGNAHSVEGAGETDSHVKTDSQTNADGRFSEGLTEQEQEALEGATNAVNRLQINAGIRAKNSVSTITSMFTEANTDSIVVPTTTSQDVVRKEIRISGVNLEGLGEASHDTAESLVAARAEKVANLYRWLDTDNGVATDKYLPVPGFERIDANVSDETKQRMIQFVGGYIEHTDNQVPKDQAQALATLFVEATLDYDWDKRVEFLTKLESYGYSFEAPHAEKSIVSFWSGKNFKQYRDVLDNAQTDGKKVVYDIDVKGNAFAIDLNKHLMRWGGLFLDPDNAEQNQLKSSIDAATFSNTGFWSSVYATGAQNDVYVIAEGGMRLGNYFWNVELPALRQLQREGLVGEIRLLDKPVSEYKDLPADQIGRRLTDAGVAVKVRFDALSHERQAELLADNPDGYKADTLVELDVKLSAIDSMLRESLPFYSLRTERNLLVQEGEEGFEVRSWPGIDGKSKTIILDDPEDAAQQKAIERFILANFDNFEQMPDKLFFVDNKVISHHEGRTRILAQKEEGTWKYRVKTELMSVSELFDAANVNGKIRGDSYQKVVDALADYHTIPLLFKAAEDLGHDAIDYADYNLESVEKLVNLRKQVEGYLLGHPDSGRVEAMNSLLNQVNTRLDEVSVLSVAEQTIQAQDSFSRLYDQLEAANLKESKHLYLDQNGDFVTKGKGNLANIDLLGSREAVLEKVKSAVSNEYGQTVADTIFAGLSAKDLAKDGKGIDIAGLNKVHQAIEQHLSPVSATLYIWKPSDHSALGHAALQIGQGRTQLEGQAAADFNQQNYVSWWPLGSKSSNISNILNVATKDQPDLKLRWSDFSQPAHQNDTLEHDVASEENDGFGLHDGDIKLKRFIEKLNAAKGIDASFKEASEGYASVLLGNPDMLETTGIPAHVFQPFVEQWNDTSYDMMDVANRFAQELRLQAQRSDDPELLEKRIGNVIRQFAERALEEIETFKASQADQGRVFRINLEGLDVAAMQAEWHRLSNDPDARYQLLTKNCSSTVAKVLKAGGADKLIGHTWLPKFGVWTPTELFNFGQALQEAQLEIAAKKQSHQVTDVLDALSGNEKPKENVAIENDGTPPRDKESLSPLTRFLNNELYGDKEARRKIGEITQTLLDHAVEKGESQKITLQGEAGRLTGYYHQGTAPREGETSTTSGKVVLFLHGSGSSAEEQASAIRNHYQKQGIDMLAVNLRGYGESDGGPSEKGLYQDARTMFNYLVNDKGIDPSNIIIHGYSMGGPIAADLARYAAQNGQAVSGLLLDRPMPSMTKAITAHEVANPAGIVGAIAKAVNGQFSVEKNLEGLPKETSILLLTDNEGLGNEGEKLRTKLTASGYNVTGEQTFYGHEASNRLMSQYADQIVSGLSSSASVDEDLDQQGLDTTSTKDQGVSNKDDHLQVVDSKEALADGKILHNQDVNGWGPITVTPTTDGGETRFDGQIIVQMENDPVVAKAAANLAGKHAESSVVVQLDSDGNYRVVYGDPSKLDGKLRWQLVGHGRDHSESNNTRLSGYSADELAVKLAKFQQSFNQAENINNKPDHISIVGCSLVSDDKQKGFGHQFINAMDANGLRVDVSVRSSELAVDEAGRKHTKDANGDWVQKAENNKVSLSWDEQGEVVAKDERIRNGIAEGDIDLSRIGVSDVDEPARGAIGDNNDVFDAPEKRKAETETSSSSANNKLSYSGNIQVNVGDGEFTAVNWGTSNVGIKVGTGGFKSLAFGDNNVMVHIGNGESKHSFDIGGYQALEGAQMFIGNRNVSFNLGRSNDLIVMMDKSIPTPPLVNPFDGAARISGVLQSIATSGEGQDWLAAQEQQWTLSGAKKFVKDMSGLDQSSSVDYTSLVELDSQNERSSRGLKHDAEAALNKQYNQWLSGNSDSDTSKLSRADKLRQANEKLAFNFAVGGQGADIQVTTGNWNFMFGDNIQSILDTNLGSLFGLITQQFSATGQAKTTFTYTPEDLPRQLKNKLLGQLAGVGAETTLADIFGVDYTASGQIVSRNGEAVDGVAILKEMLEVIGEFSGDQLQAFVDPAKLLDSLKSGINMGADGIKSFAETHGLKEKAPEEEEDNSSVSVNGASVNSAQGATVADGSTETAETQDRAFGFNSLNLPNLFATIFSQDKQKEMKSLVENLKQNLTADLLNMKEKTFDFLRNSGHLQGDGDINISLGNYNFNWGGDGKDLGAYLGDNNNFWGGRGDDVFYATGTSNIFTGGEGNDMGVLMGRENMMFGGDGNDTAVVAGRINHVFLGAGDDQSFVFGEGGEIDTGSGRDYVVTSGNFNRVDTGDDQDYSVTIGNNNQVELGAGNDFANVFGNYNRINAGAGNDVVKLMGYHAVLNGGDGDDHLIAAAISKFSQFNGGEGRDLMVLGGYQNTFKGGTDVDSFVVSGDVLDNLVEDIRSEDNIVFNGIDWQKLWFERSGYDLKLSILRDPSNDSDQSKFEHIGSVTFSDYFNGNRAQVVIGMSEKDLSGEREYTMLSDSAIDALVQAMSGFEPQAGDNGFIDSLESKSQATISMAWSDVVHKKGLMV
ncbi:MARTX multifunctional-autoprocessing repeats-in-toxin holotoxin RtxA [Vibrio cholerae]|nr:MARTX multifunctional-autoprocessing repeats-in-toxin holotoxin RtxA [Vibrio cholerae]MCD1187748.1 MARTX multifunctional-autoprocessing repeats-in-toxin holotoxin RtxA [Vibrio cholerae]HDZ9243584.1 MARTX multifunctional-autoprocessing repeats-in-toxin holotoxin RtxA [Vibrio cholerae]HDZ9482655.1 MARTX multifunctional-autoprocessing repeats-in-toxin holotoxin RtxA [Vibrio cholerae]HDZ9549468.1 MARTX multifunctional-autoprocessing repeats-in-toxin holotoxin RtxA [Vibrio cholerae]